MRQLWPVNQPGRADFYSRTSCEVRLAVKRQDKPKQPISTHAPLARCDLVKSLMLSVPTISTHAPLARCDKSYSLTIDCGINFYSRTSCEVRLKRGCNINELQDFYSRTSCEVRLKELLLLQATLLFLLTHLLRGATARSCIF